MQQCGRLLPLALAAAGSEQVLGAHPGGEQWPWCTLCRRWSSAQHARGTLFGEVGACVVLAARKKEKLRSDSSHRLSAAHQKKRLWEEGLQAVQVVVEAAKTATKEATAEVHSKAEETVEQAAEEVKESVEEAKAAEQSRPEVEEEETPSVPGRHFRAPLPPGVAEELIAASHEGREPSRWCAMVADAAEVGVPHPDALHAQAYQL